MAKPTARIPERFLTVGELADRLRVSKAAIYAGRDRDLAPGALGTKVGGRVLYDEAIIAEWLDAGGGTDWRPNGKR